MYQDYDKKITIYCNKIPKLETNILLNIILERLEKFVKFYGTTPQNILLNPYDYSRIKEERPDVIKSIYDNDYILGMKVVY